MPVAASFVFDFLDPVVNDFWNPTVWRNGLTAIAKATRVGLGTAVQQEIAYVWSLAWFPFPLPPLPPLPFAAVKVPAAAASTDAAAQAKATVPSGTGRSARPHVAKQSADTVTADAVTDTTQPPPALRRPPRPPRPDATSGKSGSATSSGDTGKKRSTAGSARSHGPKADKAAAASSSLSPDGCAATGTRPAARRPAPGTAAPSRPSPRGRRRRCHRLARRASARRR